MNWLATGILATMFAGVTAGTYFASTTGLGLSGMLDKPVSVRQDSAAGTTQSRGPRFLYFGGMRRHSGGGFRGGK